MLTAGHIYHLNVIRIDDRLAWLGDADEQFSLPLRECPEQVAVGDQLAVFLFCDRHNQRRITSRLPLAEVGQFAWLLVVSNGDHGSFLHWGLEKDLLCPFSEQPQRLEEGRRYLVHIGLDQEGRPLASARLDKFVEKENQTLSEGEQVEALVWAFTDLGAKLIVNHRYEALLYRDEIPPGLKRGDKRTAYVLRIRPDNRIDISLRRPGAAGVHDARSVLLKALQQDGFLPLHDQSAPEQIRQQLGLSKKVFKKAVGGLYKEGLIELTDSGIRLIEK